jgi:O-methyltransferase domain
MTSPAAPWKVGDPYQQMLGTVFDYWACWTIRTVAELSIADHLAAGSLTAGEVAAREGSAPETTLRLLGASVAVGLVTAEADGRFSSTPLLETLRSDNPRSLRAWILSQVAGWLPWDHVADAIRAGRTASVQAYGGMGVFDYLAAHPGEAERLSDGMTSMTAIWGPAIASKIDTTGVQCAVDVGGANGKLLQLLQRDNPSLRGIVFDRPNIVEHAKAAIKRSGLEDRTSTVGGSFFESIPAGDLLLLKFILHDWPDDECVTILQNCRRAIASGGRIAIVDMVFDKANPHAGLADLALLMASSGRVRSIEEFDALFDAAGLQRTAVLKTGTPQSVIEVGLAEAG